MFQVRIHGRGGQGVVSAAEMLSVAAFLEGKHAQAFPSFGSERMGAPVVSFCRIDEREIRAREPIVAPDAVIVQDPTLLQVLDVFEGLSPSGYALINSSHTLAELHLDRLAQKLPSGHVRTVPAAELAMQFVGRPIPNAVLMGAFAGVTGVIDIESVTEAILRKFSGSVGSKNSEAATAAYELVREDQLVGAGLS